MYPETGVYVGVESRPTTVRRDLCVNRVRNGEG